ncbi:hypothetical protein [Campylobacter sp. MIT 97-5078]|uniref:hypothetical protein n=1 Tax=Campylobacter sp. MIT 97-5078 TaxID=1548153 RepID=UPI0005142083|nr:hypothetical protein [Campylobacter sp. MIT 97-5078]KGI56105.1 hypothetical protein LR59_08845 [Campylobacter sp. MIT 97-5078]KGI57114.1 hypothetical protein LR59_04620 [Campylobacter sp. MIT 97-5078]TQR25467.1 hypothetical protein DMB91_07780 [Campylobacter sp. MIT 97-5078]
MCILCGELISSFHWSDVSFKEEKANISAGENQKERQRSRLKRAKLLGLVLAFYGLSIKEWQNSKFILSDKKGKSLIVNDLGDLWLKAEELSSKPIDIFDLNFINFLKQNHG